MGSLMGQEGRGAKGGQRATPDDFGLLTAYLEQLLITQKPELEAKKTVFLSVVTYLCGCRSG